MQLESLEGRLALSAQPAGELELLGHHLTMIQDPGQADGLLVRFRDSAFCPTSNGECKPLKLSGELPGTWSGDGLHSVSGLREVQLRQDTDIRAALAAFRAHSDVMYAEPNYRVQMTQAPNDPRFSELWGLENVEQTGGTLDVDIDAPEAWDVTTGHSTLVAVIDTGVDYTHEDLIDNMWVNPGEIPGDGIDNDFNGFIDDVHGYDFANDDPDPMDDNGHGTHVAGTIGAVGNNGVGIVGVNWDAQIMAIKFLDAGGSGTNADAIRAINYATQMGVRISNNSWGGNEPFSQGLYDAVENAGNNGQIFFAGAGNGNFIGLGQDNDVIPFYPASFDLDNIVSVAATDHQDQRAIFSNVGAESVDLAAPGVSILSTRPNNTYLHLSGTSMATPHVAGVASLIMGEHPEWTYSQVIAQIYDTVDPVESMNGITVTGGRLNAAAALGNPVPPPPPPPSGTMPIFEDYEDGEAEYFKVRIGGWSVVDGRHRALPNGDAIATVRISDPLPADLSLQVTIHGSEVQGELYSNAFVIFDYQNENEFKFAGAKFGTDEWVIGHRNGTSWTVDASITDSLDILTDYRVEVAIENDSKVTILADGVVKTSYTFAASLIDGNVGIGTWNAESYFDDFAAETYTPPPPPAAGALPIHEDFDDLVANNFLVESGSWSPSTGRYRATPNGDAISLLQVSEPLPAELELAATLNGDPASGPYYGNAFVIFDYQSPTNFKFAGLFVSSGKWAIGHRTNVTWAPDVEFFEPISAGQDYEIQLVVENGQDVTLIVDGATKASHSFTSSVVDGGIGLGTWNAFAEFDDVTLDHYISTPLPVGVLPIAEDFEDGVADFFESRTGVWGVSNGRYQAAGAGDAIATIRISDDLPADLELSALVNSGPAIGGLYSNAFLIFDYQNDTDFKFAGLLVGSGKWGIGHRIGTSWTVAANTPSSVAADTDYMLQVVIENDADVTLSVGGAPIVSHTFSGSLKDGEVGLATWNANSEFDDVTVQAYTPPPPPPSATIPLSEDFDDGVADFFGSTTGTWSVLNGRYQAIASKDAISTLMLSESIPENVVVSATLNAEPAQGGRYSNAYIVFDYQSPTNFKFAGASVGAGKWAIGHRSGSKWITDVGAADSVNANSDYDVSVRIDGDSIVTLLVGGIQKVSYDFGSSLIDGDLGLATWKANSVFDDFSVDTFTPLPPPPTATLPLWEDFEDGSADYFEPKSGIWDVVGGRYSATPSGDAVASIRTEGSLPSDLDLQVVVNGDPVSGSFYSNAFLVFDYQGPTDFKFAGPYLASGKWAIGHRSGSSWIDDSSFLESTSANTDYAIRVIIRNDSQVTLYVDGTPKVSHTFSGPISDGNVGLATRNAFSRFDDVLVQAYVSGVSTADEDPSARPEVAAAVDFEANSSNDGTSLLSIASLVVHEQQTKRVRRHQLRKNDRLGSNSVDRIFDATTSPISTTEKSALIADELLQEMGL